MTIVQVTIDGIRHTVNEEDVVITRIQPECCWCHTPTAKRTSRLCYCPKCHSVFGVELRVTLKNQNDARRE